MGLITFKKLSTAEKEQCYKQALAENRLNFLFDIEDFDVDNLKNQKVYAGFDGDKIIVFYYFYGLNENTLKIAFGYLGKFNKTVLKIIEHCLKSFRQEYGIIGEVNSKNTATIKLCKRLWNPPFMVLEGADKNNTDRYIFYWSKTKTEGN